MYKAIVLNQTHRTDRWQQMLIDFKDAPFTLERTEGVQYSSPYKTRIESKYEAVALTHLELLKKCKAEGLKTLLLLEDDVIPSDNYIEQWSKAKEYLDANLDLWDTFNGGQLAIHDVKKVIKISKDNLLLQAYGGSNSHWMYFNVDAVLPKLQESFGLEQRLEIDMFYPLKCKNYAAFPYLGEQCAGFSDISNINRDWSVLYSETKRQMKRQLRELMRD